MGVEKYHGTSCYDRATRMIITRYIIQAVMNFHEDSGLTRDTTQVAIEGNDAATLSAPFPRGYNKYMIMPRLYSFGLCGTDHDLLLAAVHFCWRCHPWAHPCPSLASLQLIVCLDLVVTLDSLSVRGRNLVCGFR